LKESKNNY